MTSREDTNYGFALRTIPREPSTVTKNYFAPIATHVDEDDLKHDEDVIAQLSNWAHRVQTKSKKVPPAKKSQISHARSINVDEDRLDNILAEHRGFLDRQYELLEKLNLPRHGVTVSSENELNQALKDHPQLLAAMPCDPKSIKKAAKKMPDRMLLQEGEMWVMVDSGAGVPGIDVGKHCPELRHKLRDAVRKKRCVLADGSELMVDKEIDLLCKFGEHELPITYSQLPVSCPILSVRRIVRRGNRVMFTDDGGYIEHKVTGRRIDFVEREGVYFVKMKILGLVEDMPTPVCSCQALDAPSPDFHRQGK